LRIATLEWGLPLRTGGFGQALLLGASAVLDQDLLQPRPIELIAVAMGVLSFMLVRRHHELSHLHLSPA
jgi:hypothetical protein